MSFYRMEITGSIGLTEYSDIHDYLGIVESKDNFTIILDECSNNNISIIKSLLKDNHFTINENGHDEDGRFYVKVHKNLY